MDKWPAYAKLSTVAPAGHLPTASQHPQTPPRKALSSPRGVAIAREMGGAVASDLTVSGRQAILAKASAKSSSLPSIKSVETSVAHLSSRSFGHQLQEQFAKTRDVYSGVLLRRAGASRDACRSNVQMRCTGGHHHRVAKGWAAAPLRGGSGIWGDQEDAASAAEDDPRPRSGLAPVSWRGESLGSCYLI